MSTQQSLTKLMSDVFGTRAEQRTTVSIAEGDVKRRPCLFVLRWLATLEFSCGDITQGDSGDFGPRRVVGAQVPSILIHIILVSTIRTRCRYHIFIPLSICIRAISEYVCLCFLFGCGVMKKGMGQPERSRCTAINSPSCASLPFASHSGS